MKLSSERSCQVKHEPELIIRDISLRFLIHFLGDIHQPLHLCGRDKGGNGGKLIVPADQIKLTSSHVQVRRQDEKVCHFPFSTLLCGRTDDSLHSVWDSGILTKNIRELGNYTTPLPSCVYLSRITDIILENTNSPVNKSNLNS